MDCKKCELIDKCEAECRFCEKLGECEATLKIKNTKEIPQGHTPCMMLLK